MSISALAVEMACTASLSEAPCARLKLMVTEGNWSWWLMASGAVRRSILAMALSGTWAPPLAGTYSLRERAGVALVLRHGLQHDAVLVGLRVDGRDLALAEGVVERIVDRLHGDAEPARRLAVDVDERAQAAFLGLVDDLAQHRGGAQLLRELGRPGRDIVRVAADQRVLVLRAAGARADLDILHRLEIQRDAGDRRDAGLQALDDLGDGGPARVARLQRRS